MTEKEVPPALAARAAAEQEPVDNTIIHPIRSGVKHGIEALAEVAIEAAMEADRRWFSEHPDATQYDRPSRDLEFYPHRVPAGALVRVTLLADGVRSRAVWIPVKAEVMQ